MLVLSAVHFPWFSLTYADTFCELFQCEKPSENNVAHKLLWGYVMVESHCRVPGAVIAD